MHGGNAIRAGQVVIGCAELQPTLDFFVERLGPDPRAARGALRRVEGPHRERRRGGRPRASR